MELFGYETNFANAMAKQFNSIDEMVDEILGLDLKVPIKNKKKNNRTEISVTIDKEKKGKTLKTVPRLSCTAITAELSD